MCFLVLPFLDFARSCSVIGLVIWILGAYLSIVFFCKYLICICVVVRAESWWRCYWLHPCYTPASFWSPWPQKSQDSGEEFYFSYLVLFLLFLFLYNSKFLIWLALIFVFLFTLFGSNINFKIQTIICLGDADETKFPSRRSPFWRKQSLFKFQANYSAVAPKWEVPWWNNSGPKDEKGWHIKNKLCSAFWKEEG